MAEKFKILSAGGKGKGLNIFRSSTYKEHEMLPTARAFWEIRWIVGIWLICALAFALAFVVEHFWRYGWSPASWHWTWIYLKRMVTTFGFSVAAEIPAWITRSIVRADFACIAPLFPIIAYFFMADATLTNEFNPYGKDKYDEKSSRKATEKDIEKMGLFNGFMMVMGYFKHKGKSVPLMMDETLSALLLAPPGTGKTQAIVLPTIFDCPGASMIINDPKPELDESSSGFRSTIGPVFIMNWAGEDDPEKGIYYPSWNPLSPEHVPTNRSQREMYVDSICQVLVPDKEGSSSDPYWTQSGRSALTGMILYIISKTERARANDYFYSRLESGTFDAQDAELLKTYYMAMTGDPNAYTALALLQKGELNIMNYVHVGTWANIPQQDIGKEASFPIILDWMTESRLKAAADLEERRRQGDQMVMMADPMKDILEGAANEAVQYGYEPRAVSALTELANKPDKERGSVLSTALNGIAIFDNAAVRARTSHSDFHFEDLRGLVDPRDGKFKPVSVYLSIDRSKADALAPLTSMFIELMSTYLLSNPPENVLPSGKKLGPYPVLFLLDELPTMQKLQAVIKGPDLGRSRKISYLFVGQDFAQIREKYSEDAVQTIMSTTAAKIVLRQNNLETAEKFSKMMGQKISTKVKKEADGKEKEEKKEEVLFSPMDIMTLPKDKEIIIYQGFPHRPIEADKRMAYADPVFSKYLKMPPASPLPEFLIPAHHHAMGYDGAPRVFDNATKETRIIETVAAK